MGHFSGPGTAVGRGPLRRGAPRQPLPQGASRSSRSPLAEEPGAASGSPPQAVAAFQGSLEARIQPLKARGAARHRAAAAPPRGGRWAGALLVVTAGGGGGPGPSSAGCRCRRLSSDGALAGEDARGRRGAEPPPPGAPSVARLPARRHGGEGRRAAGGLRAGFVPLQVLCPAPGRAFCLRLLLLLLPPSPALPGERQRQQQQQGPPTMSSKSRKSKEQGRVTFPPQHQQQDEEEEEEEEGAEEEEQQRRRRGWRGVNGGLEPPPPPQRAVKTLREPFGYYPPPPFASTM